VLPLSARGLWDGMKGNVAFTRETVTVFLFIDLGLKKKMKNSLQKL